MKVRELLAELSKQDPEADVVTASTHEYEYYSEVGEVRVTHYAGLPGCVGRISDDWEESPLAYSDPPPRPVVFLETEA